MIFFKKLLTPPIFDDEIKTQQAYLLHIILWTLFCVPIPILIYSLVATPGDSNRTLIQAAFGETVNIILLFMLRRGYVRAASIIQVSAFWFFFTVTAFTGNGVQGEAYLLGYGLVIVVAGILLGGIGASIFTFLSLAAGGWMVYIHVQGINNFIFYNSLLTTWMISAVLFPVGAVLQNLSARAIRIALSRARANEEKYRLISRVSSDYVFATEVHKDGSANLSWVAGAFEKMTGYSFEEYIASGEWPAHVHPDDAAKDIQDMERLYKNKDVKSEIRTFTKNGEVRWERIFAHPVWDEKENRLSGIIGAVQDVTEQKRTEAALAYERDLLRIFMDNIPDQIYFKDSESRFVRINQPQADFLGVDNPQDAIGKSDLDFLTPELAQQFIAEEKQIMETGQDVSNRIEFNPTNEGKPRWLLATKVPVKDEFGRAVGIIGISRDVTEQKQAESLLAYERDILQIFMDNIPDQVYFKDAESRFVRINQAQAHFLGVDSPEDSIGKTDLDFQNPKIASELLIQEKQIMETGQPVWNHTEFNPTKDGTPRWLSTTKVPAKNESGQTIGIIGISRNITEQKKAEELEQNRRAMLENVIKLGQAVTEVSDMNTTLENIWYGIHDGLHFDRLAIFLYNAENNSLDRALGTDNQGKIDKTPGMSFAIEKQSRLAQVLNKPDGFYFTHNYDSENNITEDSDMHGVKDYASVAVWAGDKPVAVICADRLLTKLPISETRLEALRLYAGYVGLAIENARLNEKIKNELSQQIQAEERERHRRATLEKIVKLGQQVTEVHDLRTTLIRIWEGIHNDLGFDRVGLFLYNSVRKSIDGSFGTDNQGEMTDEWHNRFPLDEDSRDVRPFLQTLEQPDTVFFTHSYEDDYLVPKGHTMSGVKDHALIGAWSGERPIAIISVDHRITGRPITGEQLEALRLFAGYVGLAIENARLNTALQDELSQRGETLLKQSAILNGIPDMAWLKDKDSRYIAVNEQFAKAAGMKMDEISGKTDFEIWGENYAEKYRNDDLEIIQTVQRKNIEELQTDNSGREYWVETIKTPILNTSGEVVGTTGIAREITERKKAQEAEKQRRIMLEKVIQLGKQAAISDNLEATIHKIWRGVREDLGFDRLAIFLFNPEHNTMDDTVGTNNAGEMVNQWGLSFQIDSTFAALLQNPNGIYLTNNYDVENNIPEDHEMYGIKDYVAVAAWAGDKPVAVICADHGITRNPISPEQVEALRLFGGYAGLAIDNTRLNEKIKKELSQQIQAKEREEHRREMLEKVVKLGQQVTEVHDLRTTLMRVWHGIHDELGFNRLGIYLYNPERMSMDGTFGTNNQEEMIDEWHTWVSLKQDTVESRSFLRLLEKPDTIYLTHTYENDNKTPEGHIMAGVKDFAAIAAWGGEKPVAAICVDNVTSGRPITEEQLEALRLFAGYAGLAIENARLNEKIKNELSQQIQAKEREEHRREILERVVKFGQHVTEVHDLRTTLIRIWDAIHDGFRFERIGLFLYNSKRKSMDGTFGTNNLGKMTDEWNTWYSIEQDDVNSNSFLHALEKPGTIFFTRNYEIDHQVPKSHNMYGVKDHAAIGAWAGEKPMAVICVDNLVTDRPFTEEQLEALRLFAGYAGLAIENARLNEKIQAELLQQIKAKERERNRSAILEKVVKLGQRVTEVYDLRTTLMRIWGGVHNDLGFDRLGIYLYNPERKSMDGTFGTNNDGEMIDEWHTWFSLEEDNRDSNSFLHVLEKPGTIFLTHTFENDYNIPEGHNMAGVKDHASIGAWTGERPVAIISVDNVITGRPIAEEQLEALRLFAGYAGLAIENARLKDEIENELMEQKKAEETEQRRRIMMEKVVQLGKQVTVVSDFRTTLRSIWNGVRYDLNFDRVGLFLYNSQENTMDGAYGTDRAGKIWDAWHVRIGLGDPTVQNAIVFHKVLDRPDGFYFTKDYDGEFKLPPDDEMAGVKYYAVVAVWAGNKPVAIISVDQLVTGRAFSDEQLEALRLFAGYAGLAISNANLNDALEMELTQRQNFIKELEAKNAELERFTYTVSHDLKSPLVTIKGFLGYLERDAHENNFEKFKHDTHRIETAVEKMQNLLKDLLELSRIGRLMNSPIEVSFSEIVKDALEIVDGQIKARNVLIDHKNDNVVIKCDQVRITEVLQNLIDNAIKFMGDQPNPRIEIGSLINDEHENVFYVKDNGIGIAPEFHGKIFGLFDKLTNESDGTGIGLALVKRIIEVHGGRIWVESQVGNGTTFYFTLPASKP